MRMLVKVPPLPPTFTTAAQLDRPATVCSGFIAICLGLMKVPCSAPVCLLSSAGREEEERGGREGEGEIWLHFSSPFLCVQVQGNTCLHFTPGKRTRGPEKERRKERKKKEEKKQGGIGIWRRRRSWRVFFSETQREVEKKRGGLLPGWPSEKSSDSFFGLLGLTNQHTKAKSKKRESRSGEWTASHVVRRAGMPSTRSLRPLHFCFVCFPLKKLNYASTLLHRLICNTSHIIIPAL